MCTLQTLVVEAFETTQRLKEMLQGAGLLVPNMLPCKLIQVGDSSLACQQKHLCCCRPPCFVSCVEQPVAMLLS
jgi:hypothetical protein